MSFSLSLSPFLPTSFLAIFFVLVSLLSFSFPPSPSCVLLRSISVFFVTNSSFRKRCKVCYVFSGASAIFLRIVPPFLLDVFFFPGDLCRSTIFAILWFLLSRDWFFFKFLAPFFLLFTLYTSHDLFHSVSNFLLPPSLILMVSISLFLAFLLPSPRDLFHPVSFFFFILFIRHGLVVSQPCWTQLWFFIILGNLSMCNISPFFPLSFP